MMDALELVAYRDSSDYDDDDDDDDDYDDEDTACAAEVSLVAGSWGEEGHVDTEEVMGLAGDDDCPAAPGQQHGRRGRLLEPRGLALDPQRYRLYIAELHSVRAVWCAAARQLLGCWQADIVPVLTCSCSRGQPAQWRAVDPGGRQRRRCRRGQRRLCRRRRRTACALQQPAWASPVPERGEAGRGGLLEPRE
jgi:hypothetical protein